MKINIYDYFRWGWEVHISCTQHGLFHEYLALQIWHSPWKDINVFIVKKWDYLMPLLVVCVSYSRKDIDHLFSNVSFQNHHVIPAFNYYQNSYVKKNWEIQSGHPLFSIVWFQSQSELVHVFFLMLEKQLVNFLTF